MEISLATIRVNGRRLWQSLIEMAAVGATAKGGVCRLALSDEDRAGRDLFAEWCRQAGCTVQIDAIGNMFARRAGAASSPVVMGSHLDSQPTGGKFDGAYGVLAGLEVIRTLNDRNVQTDAPLEVAVWTNEEGARFAPAMLGSAVFSGSLSLREGLDSADAEGHTIEQELARIGYRGTIPPGEGAIGAHLELHIEQGPILERERTQIGVVTGVQGIRWYDLVVSGTEAHAGPTPMPMRRDPVQASIRVLSAIYELADRFAPDARVTVGELRAYPGSRNTVPGRVRLTLDIRHPDETTLARMDQEMRRSIASLDSLSCTVAITEVWLSKPVAFAPVCTAAVRSAAAKLGYSHRDIVSGAGHDSVNLSKVAPTGMIFIPCRGGVSHNELEEASPEQVEAGANVLLHAALHLSQGSR